RAGVLTGEAAVTPGRVGEGMVAGDLVNTASRLQSVAPPGSVLVGEATYQATSAAIAYEPAGEQVLKGKLAPVAAWRALRVVARVGGEGREEGLEPPFVGRDEELRLLKDQVHAAERDRKLRMVAITGQAGIGKSRLIWELEKYLDGLAGPNIYYWHRGRSPSYGEGIAFWALGEMVRRRARIAEGEDEVATREKLSAALVEFVPDADARRSLEPALGALLGIEEADWTAREQLFSAWRAFFERVADRGPTILAFEDLQWADDGLLDFIEHLLDWARDRPIVIITLARPELLDRRPNFGMGHRQMIALHLEPLSDEAMATLLGGLVPTLRDDDMARIVERAEGVPLYAVEMVRALVDGGQLVRRGDVYELVGELPALDVPPTLRALIASRLDALSADDRALLQDAAVLGLAFSVNALAALAGRPEDEVGTRLRALAHKELVGLETDPRSPERGQYIFRQGLIREVAYSTLSKRERRAHHLAAAHFYETLDDDELAGVRATHYAEAFRAAPEGEEGAAVAAQARVALRAAAHRAARLHSHQQALDYYERAMAVTFDPAELDELRQRAFDSATVSGELERGERHILAAVASLEERGEHERAAEAKAVFGGWLLETSRIDEAMELLENALAALPPHAERASVDLRGQLARGHLFRGEGQAALAAIDSALEVAERLRRYASERLEFPDARGTTLQLLITKSWALSQVGRVREGIALLYGVMALADGEDELFARLRARYNLSSYVFTDDPHESLRISREGMAIARQYGLALAAAMAASNGAGAALVIGDLDTVFELEGEITSAQTSLASFVHAAAAIAAALRGDREGTSSRMALVEERVAGSTSAQDRGEWLGTQAAVAFAEGDLLTARRLAVEAREAYAGGAAAYAFVVAGHAAVMVRDLAALRNDASWYDENRFAAAWLERSWRTIEAVMMVLEGRVEEGRQAYRRVIDEWRQADLRFDLALALLERARLLGAQDADALAGRAEAEAIFAAMGAAGFAARLERGADAAASPVGKEAPAVPSRS
ncbi:MAG: AAA family ATPase, partial [Chloroflexota bacterium]|nr:AAA family ATPase [Chloroflexota bacterium]